MTDPHPRHPRQPTASQPPATANAPVAAHTAAFIAAIRDRTPARLLLERRGGSYRTSDQLALREDHAAAVDAVWRAFDPHRDWPADFRERWNFVEAASAATTKEDHIRRPDLGRVFSCDSAAKVVIACPHGADLQIVVGDGLSAGAIAKQVPRLLPLVAAAAARRDWSVGRPILVRHCRVGILNQVGAMLSPRVAVLLIGERPGLRTAESLSAYMAYRPAADHTDAHRNLVSNIHAAGSSPDQAAERITVIVAEMLRLATSGPAIKEVLGQHATLASPQRTTAHTMPSRPSPEPPP